jgi:hypothetical protein
MVPPLIVVRNLDVFRLRALIDPYPFDGGLT